MKVTKHKAEPVKLVEVGRVTVDNSRAIIVDRCRVLKYEDVMPGEAINQFKWRIQ
jgi:hypothetical protein